MPYVLKYMACVFCGVRMREGIVAVLERVHGIIFLRMYAKVCGVCHLEGLVPFVMPKVLSISLRMFVKGRSMCSVVFRVSVTL